MKFELEIVGIQLTKKQLKKILQKKMDNWIRVMNSERNKFMPKFLQHMDKSLIVKFIKSPEGQGQLGIVDPENIIGNMYAAMGATIFVSTAKKNLNDAGRIIDFKIGQEDALKRFTEFFWTNSRNENRSVSLWQLIEDGDVPGTGYENYKVDDYIYAPGVNLEYSRTGLGTMVPADGQAYKLPAEFIEGFSRAVRDDRVLKLIATYMKSRLKKA